MLLKTRINILCPQLRIKEGYPKCYRNFIFRAHHRDALWTAPSVEGLYLSNSMKNTSLIPRRRKASRVVQCKEGGRSRNNDMCGMLRLSRVRKN